MAVNAVINKGWKINEDIREMPIKVLDRTRGVGLLLFCSISYYLF